MKDEPLGLPEGTVRALIALVVISGTIIYFIVYKTMSSELLTISSLIIGYYFGQRNGETVGKAKQVISTNGTNGVCNTTNQDTR